MPEYQNGNVQVVAHGSVQDICDYLNCSRSTLWRRMKDNPERFIRLGRSQILLVIPQQLAEQIEEKTV